jgi:hypothetical protein
MATSTFHQPGGSVPIAKIGPAEGLAKADIDGDEKIDLIGGGSQAASVAGVWNWSLARCYG